MAVPKVSRLSVSVLFSLLLLTACEMPKNTQDMPSRSSGMASLGRQMQEKGEIGPAVDFYRRALMADPKNPEAIKGLGDVLEKWGDQQGAMAVYRDGVAANPEDGDIRRAYARMLLAADDPMGARAHYEAALKVNEDDVKARSGLGVALDYMGEHAQAQKQYRSILEDDPRNLAVINNLAYSYVLSHRYNQAIQLLEPELQNPSATPAMRQNLALAYGMAGMDDDARRVAAMDLSPDKVAETMEYYRRQRAEVAVTTAPYAELGTYATEAMAIAQIQKMKEKVAQSKGDYKPVVVPQVTSPGGTPRFAVRMMGCSRPDDISRLCAILNPAGIPCTAKGGRE